VAHVFFPEPEKASDSDNNGLYIAVLIDKKVAEPPLPPKVSIEQATHFAESLARGTPNAGKIALTVASDVVREVI
jgi:hypothetical protein